jgi:hypothetical protein
VIAPRFLPVLCVVFGVALVPTLIHSYGDNVATDGRRTAALPRVLNGYEGAPSDRNEGWGKRRFDSDDWIEREYSRSGDRIRLTAIRSYDPKSLYHHPELAIAYGTAFAGEDTRRFDRRPDVPVHVLRPLEGANAIGAYVLHYGDRFVDNAIWFQIRAAGELLFSQRQPMTIFFVLDQSVPSPPDVAGSSAVQLLFAAVDSFVAQTPTPDVLP